MVESLQYVLYTIVELKLLKLLMLLQLHTMDVDLPKEEEFNFNSINERLMIVEG
jgi:hypothetical protein